MSYTVWNGSRSREDGRICTTHRTEHLAWSTGKAERQRTSFNGIQNRTESSGDLRYIFSLHFGF